MCTEICNRKTKNSSILYNTRQNNDVIYLERTRKIFPEDMLQRKIFIDIVSLRFLDCNCAFLEMFA